MDSRASPLTHNTPAVAASLRSSFKTDKPQPIHLRKAVLLTQSRKSIFKNRSEETFESNQCLEDSNLLPFEPSAMLSRNLSRQSEANRHQKSQSAHYRPLGQHKKAKTECSSALRQQSILSRLAKRQKQPKQTINELMRDKFRPSRAYEASKRATPNLLPSFLSFSISRRQRCEAAMAASLRCGSFKGHRVYFQNRFIFM